MWTAHLAPGEQQRPVADWPGYYITDLGRVISYKTRGRSTTIELEHAPHELRPVVSRVGYARRKVLVVTLKQGRARTKLFLVAWLVAQAFIGPKPPGQGVLHGDDDYRNNRLANLRYGTAQDNGDDAARNGRMSRGEGHHSARLTDDQARAVRESPHTVAELAAEYRVSRGVIEPIKRGQTYAHVGGTLRYEWSGRGRRTKQPG